MTPAERAARCARACSCKSCRPRLERMIEAEIREAAKPLVEALRKMANVTDYASRGADGISMDQLVAMEEAEMELAKWA